MSETRQFNPESEGQVRGWENVDGTPGEGKEELLAQKDELMRQLNATSDHEKREDIIKHVDAISAMIKRFDDMPVQEVEELGGNVLDDDTQEQKAA